MVYADIGMDFLSYQLEIAQILASSMITAESVKAMAQRYWAAKKTYDHALQYLPLCKMAVRDQERITEQLTRLTNSLRVYSSS